MVVRARGRLTTIAGLLIGGLAISAFGVACAPSLAQGGAQGSGAQRGASPSAPASANPQEQAPVRVIDHVMPARDSIGRAPARFSWTAIEGADGYAIGVWNEVDQMVWRRDHIPTTSIDCPAEVTFEPGTYFWSVSALQEGQELAESGLAAFVVRTAP